MRDRATLRAALLAGAVILLALAGAFLPVGAWLEALLRWTRDLGPWAALALALVWLPAAVLLVPGSLITLGTGFVLGPGWGIAVVSLGSTLGATIAFLVGRRLGREWVRGRVGRREALEGVDRGIAEEGLKVVLLLRLSPIVPYNALNYALALTGVSLRDFVLGSWLGMLPGTVLYVGLGAGARSIAALATGTTDRSGWWLAAFAAGILATALAVLVVTRAARRALAGRTAAG
ncbi:MAG TPA: TVP38/TMEM64 family protein [Gemmatimonadota bacterium]|nr:TVP38/TMEM64 family protein [Gemmatimonadota bacterium]